MAGTFQPRGKAERVEGGYRVTGQWPFGSNCANADWLLGTAVVAGTEPPEPRICSSRWRTARSSTPGTRSGSRARAATTSRLTTCSCRSAIRSRWPHMFGGPQGNPDAVLRRPFFDIAAPTLAAVRLASHGTRSSRSWRWPGARRRPRHWTLGTMHSTHMQLGQAEALLRSARAYLYDVVRGLDGPAEQRCRREAADFRLASRMRHTRR